MIRKPAWDSCFERRRRVLTRPYALATSTTVGETLQLTPVGQYRWKPLKQGFGDMLSNTELPVGPPPAGRPVHLTEVALGAAPSFDPSYRRSPKLKQEIETNDQIPRETQN